MAARALAAALAAAAAGLASCGGDDPSTEEQIRSAVRAVYGAAPLLVAEGVTRKEFAQAREAFCDALVVYTGDPRVAPSELLRLPIPPRATCREGVDDHENAKVLGFTELASIGRIDVKGDRAEVRFRAKVPANPKKTYQSGAVLVRRAGRWRVVLPCDVIGCYPELLPPGQANRPRPKVLDETRGRYRGTALGDRRSAALRRQGTPPAVKTDEGSGPVGSDFYEDGTPSNWSPPGRSPVAGRDLSYRGRAYLVADGRGDRPVYGFIVTDRRAETARGVGIGDTLAYARRRYPQLRCDVVNQGTEYVTFPACRARIAPRRYLGFGQNPIRSISLMTVPFDGAK